MTDDQFRDYLASAYQVQAGDQRIQHAAPIAVETFGSEKPWSWACGPTTKTTDANGIITFDDDFDGVLTMREQASSSGGWIFPWSVEKFDYEMPRLDNLSGSYSRVCKIYKEDGVWKGQMAPPVASQEIYVFYKRTITSIQEIPNKFVPGAIACAHTILVKPGDKAYADAVQGKDLMIKQLWKKDRVNWSRIFQTFDEGNVREYVRWFGTWSW